MKVSLRGQQQNISDQRKGFWQLKGEGVQGHLINFANEGFFERLHFYWLIGHSMCYNQRSYFLSKIKCNELHIRIITN